MNTIKEAQRIVVKVGTSSLTHATGKVNIRMINRLAAALSDLHNAGREVALVSSGALSVGVSKLGLAERPKDTPTRQAAAAVGQCELMFMYDKYFGECGNKVGQLLLTMDDFAHEQRRENLLNTFDRLFALGAIPVINENDSVSTEEIEGLNFGDNDKLSAMVAQLVSADALIMLTDTDGLYTANPNEDENAQLIPVVPCVTDEILALGGDAGSARGTGGMFTKLQAAKLATEAGIDTVIANAAPENLYALMDGRQIGTLFRRQA
ncbi:MAG: glutamate 5-kinase [Oscillospiraceae bacterium]|nr:glutamate 5-kinase [Oscillospiraceae bacterium]